MRTETDTLLSFHEKLVNKYISNGKLIHTSMSRVSEKARERGVPFSPTQSEEKVVLNACQKNLRRNESLRIVYTYTYIHTFFV